MTLKFTLGIFLLALFTFGCSSSDPLAPLTVDSEVSRENAIIIFNVGFTDRYFDLEKEEEVSYPSRMLLKDKKRIEKQLISKRGKRLREPLYEIGKLKLDLASQEKEVEVERFGLDLDGYKNIGIYAVKPGLYELNQLKMVQYRLTMETGGKGVERRYPFTEAHQEKIGSWQLEAGKIYYLGDLELNFRSDKQMFGLYPREQLVTRIRIEKIELQDRLEEVIEALKVQESWFPVKNIVNRSENKVWQYFSVEDQERIKKVEREEKAVEEKIKKRETRDKAKFFF